MQATEKATSAEPVTPATHMKKVKQPWSDSKRAFHRLACKDKEKLSLGQKLEIVHRALATSDSKDYRTQAQLAAMFKKSRSAISKILRPENVQKLRQVAATGMHLDVKRHSWRDSSVQFLELERRVHQFVLAHTTEAEGAPRSSTVCQHAEDLARQIGVENFKGTYGWFTRFMRRHGLYSSMKDKAEARSTLAGSLPQKKEPTKSPPLSALDVSSGGSGDSLSCSASVDSSASTILEAVPNRCDDGDFYGGMMPTTVANPTAQFLDMHGFAAPEPVARGYFDYHSGSAHRPVDANRLDMAFPGWQMHGNICQSITSNVKVTFETAMGKVLRRMQISFPMGENSGRVIGLGILYRVVLSAFHLDIEGAGCSGMPRLSYFDDEGDQIAISNDHELGMALHTAMCSPSPLCGPTLRLHLHMVQNE